MKKTALLFFIIGFFGNNFCQETFSLKNNAGISVVGKYLSLYEDKDADADLRKIIQKDKEGQFYSAQSEIINFNVTHSVMWCKLRIQNNSDADDWYIDAGNYAIENFCLYEEISPGNFKKREGGIVIPEKQYELYANRSMFKISIPKDSARLFYISLKDKAPLIAFIRVGRLTDFFASNHIADLLHGMFLGLMLMLVIYNLFIFISVRERTYLYYMIYVFFSALFIAFQNGYVLHFPSSLLWLFRNHPVFIPVIFGGFGVLFCIRFLELKKYAPKFLLPFRILMYAMFGGGAIDILGFKHESVIIIQFGGMIMAFLAIPAGIVVLRKGYKPAKFYLLAWSFLFVGLFIFILSEFKFVPANAFTHNAFEIGCAFEAVLLSIALADKIKNFKTEKEKAQEESLRQAKENERIIREQNIILEKKVEERTHELMKQKEIIEEINNDILSSIRYAKRIQNSLLTSELYIKKNLDRMNQR